MIIYVPDDDDDGNTEEAIEIAVVNFIGVRGRPSQGEKAMLWRLTNGQFRCCL